MDKVSLIMGYFPDYIYDSILLKSKGQIQNAANNLQKNYISGFIRNYDEVTIHNVMYINSFPNGYKDISSCENKTIIKDNLTVRNLKFNNLIFLNMITKYFALKKSVKKDTNTTFVFYAVTLPMILLARHLKRNRKIKTIFIVPDLPEYMFTGKRMPLYYKILKPIENLLINHNRKYIDKYIYLTKYMSKFDSKKEFLIIEGISSTIENNIINNTINDCVTFAYSGTLDEKYGIKTLVDIFTELDNKYILKICGDGDMRYYIESLKCCNIEYSGVLSHKDSIQMLLTSDILVNPRLGTEEFTKYSFPSKILEYLSTYKPVLCYKLPGIPQEYDNLLHYIDDFPSFKDAILNIKEITKDYPNRRENIKKFIDSKSSYNQVKRIKEFI